MATIGFHASHEQVAPARLLRDVQYAEQAGFAAAMCSDHIAPWSVRQGHSGFAWSWLGAALATTDLSFGVVTSMGHRYHPAVLAQASATLASMFPARFWVALGSGENLNEHVVGHGWPAKEVRQQHLERGFHLLRRLHAGETVSDSFGPVVVDEARVWEVPEVKPPLILPALTPETARRCARTADGLITVNQPLDGLREICTAYREHGGRGPIMLQVHLSWAETQGEAEAIAFDQWRTNVFDPPVMADLPSVADFEARADRHDAHARLAEAVNISADLNRHADWISEFLELGVDSVFLHHVGKEQVRFIEAFGDRVLPQLR
ncbi:TIGR03885 family FMN-dependent LLM class oxidoreductase [Leucobacter sp. CSA1]|uniref:TIGR03885 family FMN-dependent LLM class oxidoreductase n=1 Tax=Leucobacter chromiisoli TaxID=2796471 RepID=A0A934Q3Z2_9MICO|nr:TIGR03885 family FMN-dependent LLM class oxidoreductase [Leucobacter chromiisoli]MBK0418020.1 TIGR03885 family FMN-dependent LLM class oxidoreductase [Leucobacter chromiisoli]